ncbi:ribonuclease J [Butyrivibrio hungatei]|uniref:Ribonuclease J n=1 Tax=Butyrivibrio hungatei TaxID=185008 RepID=A0A1G5EW34_9FIRM|nr:ribonuclease J [Butyrivibrio hungatei]SCY31031.1 ribonuclease J [Butyrivibrio hungatei]
MEDSIKIIPLGGFDKIGMNITLIESSDSIIAIDCGMSFPPDNLPGVAAIIPDVSYLSENSDKFKGIILTHGHEDHIGALPYVFDGINVPVYGTPLTIAMVEKKFRDFGIKKVKTKAIKFGSTIVVGDFKIEFIRGNHSIPDSAMLAIYTSQGIIFNTGDFKFDMSPVMSKTADLARLTAIGTKGVLAVLSDSTNAMQSGFSRSERYVNDQLDRFFNMYRKNRLIIVTFATNMERVQQIINLALKYGRKIALEGDLLLDVFSAARKLGYINIPDNMLVENDMLDKCKDEELIFLTTGNHGESVKCISEIAAGNNPVIRIKKNDVVLFSSVTIHGSELEFSHTINSLEEQGARIEFQDLHATGHACAEELKLLFTMLHPKFVIPAHGEYRYRREAKRIAMEVGISSDDVFLIKNGDIIELKEDKCEIVGKIPLNEILIDGREKSKIDNLVICDRMRLSESGVVIIEICIDKKTGRCVSDLNIRCRGFLDEEKFSEISDELKDLSMKEISRFLGQGVRDERISNGITALAENFIKEKCEKTPIVIAFVTNVML